MKKVFLSFIACLLVGVITIVMWTGSAYGRRVSPVKNPPGCQKNLEMCSNDLGICEADLAGCEADCQIFPGDGQDNNPPLDFGLPDHGPALSYTNNLDGTVTDNNTGFMWEEKTGTRGTWIDCTDATVCPNPHHVNNRYTWTDTGDSDETDPDGTLFNVFLDQLNNACDGDSTISCSSEADCGPDGPCGFAGFRDWCIPNAKKLQSIVDYGVVLATIDPTFGATQWYAYWSSTTSASNPIKAWAVDFALGGVGIGDKADDFIFARAVRPCM
jgi:hypothetical protein